MTDVRTAAIERAQAALEVARGPAKRGPTLKLSRLYRGLKAEVLDGEDREYLEEVSIRAGRPFDPTRPILPWSAIFQRTLDTGNGGANGGYLASTQMPGTVIDVLRTAQPGLAHATILTDLVGSVPMPRQTGSAALTWLPAEESSPAASAPTLGQISLSPKNASAGFSYSLQLAKQSNVEAMSRRDLARSIATGLYIAACAGSGASGQPQGIIGAKNVSTISGASLSWPSALGMQSTVAGANANDAAVTWTLTPNVRAALAGRDKATGSGRFVWEDDQIAGRDAFVTTGPRGR